jgi:hypothetical protein
VYNLLKKNKARKPPTYVNMIAVTTFLRHCFVCVCFFLNDTELKWHTMCFFLCVGHSWKQGQWTKEEVELLQNNITQYCEVGGFYYRRSWYQYDYLVKHHPNACYNVTSVSSIVWFVVLKAKKVFFFLWLHDVMPMQCIYF